MGNELNKICPKFTTGFDTTLQGDKLKLDMSPKRINKSHTDLKGIEKLLNQQTTVILSAVDEKIARLEKRIGKLEIKVDQRFDQLITTLDKFLKRLKDLEDEMEIIKLDINRLKKVVREKLGVDLS